MRCYFIRGGHIADVDKLADFSDEEAIARAHALFSERKDLFEGELCGKVGDGVNQAADLISATASIPSLNCIPLTTFGNWF